ncbi:XRE family transcriptional regulator [Actinacidiphila cocklensis]|uniref:XRE family transcriptional regulator n=2 Tax=Actinacidiphila cocklensis TaxID=887465 RepID=A0A9W4DKH9_9ACTN|nr:XRE family transcriptional regulator [Actinacidiphila cocklensis]
MAELPADPLAELARQLRTLKAQRGLQTGGLQQRTGLGRTTLSQALSGHRAPSETTLVLLAKALGADPEPLLALRSAAARPPVSRASRAVGPLSFEQRYRAYVELRHSRLTVVGLDLSRPERAHWPLDAAYLSLELAERTEGWPGGDEADQPRLVVKRAEHALSERRRVLLRGLAGSGKSTLLQWLAVAAAREELPEELADWRGRIPFVLPLRSLVRRGPLPAPQEFLAAVGTPLASSQPEGWAEGVLARGEGLVLVDGIDEVPQGQRSVTRDWLEELLAAYQDSVFVVTTRPSAVPEGWLGASRFTELTVRPMSAADIGVFVGRWHAAARRGTESAEEQRHLHELESALRMTVRAQRDLAQLSSTPLMCALVCALHRDRRGHLPHSRMELYQAALSMLLVRRDRERSIDIPEGIQLTEHQSVKLLQRLAYWLIRNRQTEMDYPTALALISDALPAMPTVAEQGPPEQVLAHLIGRSGLLRQPTTDTVDFVHRTFQDYLGAKAAIEAHDFHLLINNAQDDQWEDVIRMAVAHARPAESTTLLRRLIARGDNEPKHRPRLHLLAQASLRYATEIEPAARQLTEQRARALMPPRSPEEADTLAGLGAGVLDLLPSSPENLEVDELEAIVRTAGAIGGDQAYAFLQGFFNQLPEKYRGWELNNAWRNFDVMQFVRDFLPHLSGKPMLHIETREQVAALHLLLPVQDVQLDLDLTAEEILGCLDPEHVKSIGISGKNVNDLEFMRSFPHLREISLRGCEKITNLGALSGLSLTSIRLSHCPEHFSFASLSRLPALTDLFLYSKVPYETLAELPCTENLKLLWLGPEVKASTVGISRWQQLKNFVANRSLTAEEWDEISQLKNLELVQGLPNVAGAPLMTTVKTLTLDEATDESLQVIAINFPRLKNLTIHRQASRAVIDLSRLRTMRDLRVTLNRSGEKVKLGGFPAERLTIKPRPRDDSWRA